MMLPLVGRNSCHSFGSKRALGTSATYNHHHTSKVSEQTKKKANLPLECDHGVLEVSKFVVVDKVGRGQDGAGLQLVELKEFSLDGGKGSQSGLGIRPSRFDCLLTPFLLAPGGSRPVLALEIALVLNRLALPPPRPC